MPKFKIGDHVERIGAFVPVYMKRGIVMRVIPNKHGQDWFNEYEVKFDDTVVGIFYESQLRLIAEDSSRKT
jgi:hypothetical protein